MSPNTQTWRPGTWAPRPMLKLEPRALLDLVPRLPDILDEPMVGALRSSRPMYSPGSPGSTSPWPLAATEATNCWQEIFDAPGAQVVRLLQADTAPDPQRYYRERGQPASGFDGQPLVRFQSQPLRARRRGTGETATTCGWGTSAQEFGQLLTPEIQPGLDGIDPLAPGAQLRMRPVKPETRSTACCTRHEALHGKRYPW